MSWYVLGVDVGTTAIKAALFDEDGVEIAEHTEEYDLLTPRAGYVELEPGTYTETFAEAVASLLRESSVDVQQIRALGLSAQGETMLCLDSADRPLGRAIVWMDNRASTESDELEAHFGRPTIHAVTGQPAMDPIWPAAKILWLKRNDPDRFAATARFALLKDFLVQRLTGRLVSEDSLLCSTLVWDINTRKYWPEMLDYLGIDSEKLPEIADQGEIVGALTDSAATELGLPAGLPVSVGALDQACGALGLGNAVPGLFSESTGSALTTVTVVDELRLDAAGRVPCFAAALPGQYMLHTFSTGGMVMRWFRDEFCSSERRIEQLCGINAYQLIDEEVRRVDPGSDGLVVLPHLQGSGPPDLDPHARGAFFGLTLSHTKQHLSRGIMEGVAMVLRRMIESTEDLGVEITEIISLSGGAKSAAWCQIKADATGRPVHTVKGAGSAACRGAAIIAGVAAELWPSAVDIACAGLEFSSTYKPNAANAAVYDDLYTRFLALQEATKLLPRPVSTAS